MKKILLLTDANESALRSFKEGICESLPLTHVDILENITNNLHGSAYKSLKRYFEYFSFPLNLINKIKDYDLIIGWQQFYANNLAMWCRFLHITPPPIVSVNFTYKSKGNGLIGKIYNHYMHYAINNSSMSLIHLPSHVAAENLHNDFGIPKEKILVTSFGIDDRKNEIANLPFSQLDKKEYIFSIGRSNRDFDFLVQAWKSPLLENYKLIIASDTWKPTNTLPSNVIHLDNLHGDASLAFLYNAKVAIIPIDKPNIASGDTVLLRAMSYGLPIVITAPSTLSEMYIRHNQTGLALPKEEKVFASQLSFLLKDEIKLAVLGRAARQSFLENFSLQAMGRAIGKGSAHLL